MPHFTVSNNNNMADAEDEKIEEGNEGEEEKEEENEFLEGEEKLGEETREEVGAVVPEVPPTTVEEDKEIPEPEHDTHEAAEVEEGHKDETEEPEAKQAEDVEEKEQVEENYPDDEVIEPVTEFEREKSENELPTTEEQTKDEDVIGDEEEVIEKTDKEGEEHIVKEDEVIQEPVPEIVEETVPSEDENVIGVVLSREVTPEIQDVPLPDHGHLEASTPVSDVLEQEEKLPLQLEETKEQAEDEDLSIRKEELINQYEEALARREKLQHRNMIIQHKLFDYFRKKKTDEFHDIDKNVADQEQRYLKYMAQLEDLKKIDSARKEYNRLQIEDMKVKCREKKTKADEERRKFIEFKRNIALHAINAYNGKPVPPKDIDQYIANELKKEQEVMNIRLENIKLKNKMKKREQQLKLKEELVEGLHLIDFEQLKIENQTYNEKIEERNEELLKFRKKITSTVQILTHLKEKLQFVQAENLLRSNEMKEVEAVLAQNRDILSRTKHARDALRIDNTKLRQKCGFLGNESLLKDFETQKGEGSELQSKLQNLKMKHAELTLHCHHVQQKVAQAGHAHL